MPYEDYSIFVFLIRQLKYKSIYISSYVQLNIVLETLQEIDKMLLYITTNVAIKPNLQGLTKFANASGNNDLENNNFEQISHLRNLEKIIEKIVGKHWYTTYCILNKLLMMIQKL
jgi:hypothetical protein